VKKKGTAGGKRCIGGGKKGTGKRVTVSGPLRRLPKKEELKEKMVQKNIPTIDRPRQEKFLPREIIARNTKKRKYPGHHKRGKKKKQ